ncbi:MAG TPA: lipocalin-like domain-containing protein, partial [Blastocatellia bacterium]
MNEFVGAWKLVAVEDDLPGGDVIYPYGRDAAGLLIYDASGKMSVQIMKRDRAPLSSNDSLDAPAEEIKTAVEGFTSFFGAYEVDPTAGIITHHVEGHLFPASVGKALKREFEFSGNRLVLRPSL